MKILYVAPYATQRFLSQHGISRFCGIGALNKVSSLLEILAAAGHDVVLLSSASYSNGRSEWSSSEREYVSFGTDGATILYPGTILKSPFGGALNCLRCRGLVRDVLRDFVPDVAIVYNSYVFETLAAREVVRRTGAPIILEIEDLPRARRRGWLNVKPVLDGLCWQGLLESASGYLAVNERIANMLLAEKPRAILPGIVDPELVELAARRSVAFSGGKRVLGYFGGLDPGKGIGALLDVVPRLAHPWQLVVSGAGSLASRFARVSVEYPAQLRFLGRVSRSQLYREMCGCDCLVVPLERVADGGQGVFPFKVFEYLVSGGHVIASSLSNVEDLDLSFTQSWDGDADSLLVALSTAKNRFDENNDLRQRAVKQILCRYDYWAVGDTLGRLLDSVVSRTPVRGDTEKRSRAASRTRVAARRSDEDC
jgi:glycosyltransferase involved in cell wall biosynthesis